MGYLFVKRKDGWEYSGETNYNDFLYHNAFCIGPCGFNDANLAYEYYDELPKLNNQCYSPSIAREMKKVIELNKRDNINIVYEVCKKCKYN